MIEEVKEYKLVYCYVHAGINKEKTFDNITDATNAMKETVLFSFSDFAIKDEMVLITLYDGKDVIRKITYFVTNY